MILYLREGAGHVVEGAGHVVANCTHATVPLGEDDGHFAHATTNVSCVLAHLDEGLIGPRP